VADRIWKFGEGTVVVPGDGAAMALELPAVPLGESLYRLTGVEVRNVADVVVAAHGETVEGELFYLATQVPDAWDRREIDNGVYAWVPPEDDDAE